MPFLLFFFNLFPPFFLKYLSFQSGQAKSSWFGWKRAPRQDWSWRRSTQRGEIYDNHNNICEVKIYNNIFTPFSPPCNRPTKLTGLCRVWETLLLRSSMRRLVGRISVFENQFSHSLFTFSFLHQSTHVPYRDSRLTHLLQASFSRVLLWFANTSDYILTK